MRELAPLLTVTDDRSRRAVESSNLQVSLSSGCRWVSAASTRL